ncbi:MAG: hypothetical protein LBI18_12400, partial [Planctomycetaceae bacterium]|nr:hypothetical protein [Planctomycetaceae bacterium]
MFQLGFRFEFGKVCGDFYLLPLSETACTVDDNKSRKDKNKIEGRKKVVFVLFAVNQEFLEKNNSVTTAPPPPDYLFYLNG